MLVVCGVCGRFVVLDTIMKYLLGSGWGGNFSVRSPVIGDLSPKTYSSFKYCSLPPTKSTSFFSVVSIIVSNIRPSLVPSNTFTVGALG